MIDSDYNAPSSEKTLYCNEFIMKTPQEHAEDMKSATKNPVVHDTTHLMPAHAGDPHQTVGIANGATYIMTLLANLRFLASQISRKASLPPVQTSSEQILA